MRAEGDWRVGRRAAICSVNSGSFVLGAVVAGNAVRAEQDRTGQDRTRQDRAG